MLTACSTNSAVTGVRNDSQLKFSSKWLPLLIRADAEIWQEYDDISCFDIYLDETETEKIVAFLPLKLVQIDGDRIVYKTFYDTKCGQSVAFHFDKKNEVRVRKIYQR